jgi:O-methyltransferase involved in polyketide biosynthesis
MDMASIPPDWAQRLTERSQRIGSTINLAELFYMGERNGAGDYLKAHGWDVEVRSTEDAYAANGFTLPDDEMAAFAGGSGYLSATFG